MSMTIVLSVLRHSCLLVSAGVFQPMVVKIRLTDGTVDYMSAIIIDTIVKDSAEITKMKSETGNNHCLVFEG